MSDNEHSAASLGHSEPLSVKYPPDHAIPEVHQASDDRSEGVLMSASGESMNVFSNNPGGAALSNDPMHLPPERATVTSQSCTASCHAVVLAGESSGENIDCWWFGDVMDVSEVGNIGPVVSEDSGCVRVKFGLPRHLHADTFGGEVEPSDPGEQGTDLHHPSPLLVGYGMPHQSQRSTSPSRVMVGWGQIRQRSA